MDTNPITDVRDLRISDEDRRWLQGLDIDKIGDMSQLQVAARRLHRLLNGFATASGAELFFMIASQMVSNLSDDDRPVVEAAFLRVLKILALNQPASRDFPVPLDEGEALATVRVGPGSNASSFELRLDLALTTSRILFELMPKGQVKSQAQ